jgi:hypothetical protein
VTVCQPAAWSRVSCASKSAGETTNPARSPTDSAEVATTWYVRTGTWRVKPIRTKGGKVGTGEVEGFGEAVAAGWPDGRFDPPPGTAGMVATPTEGAVGPGVEDRVADPGPTPRYAEAPAPTAMSRRAMAAICTNRVGALTEEGRGATRAGLGRSPNSVGILSTPPRVR